MQPTTERKAPVHRLAIAALVAAAIAGVLALYGSLVAETHLAGSPLNEARKRFHGPVTRGVAQALPIASGRFDFVTMGIALRHVPDLVVAFREYRRVLKPGGRVWILEAHVPESPIGHKLTRFAWASLVPNLTLLFTGSRDAKLLMDYYWDTVDQCVPPEQIVQAMTDAGFENARTRVTLPGAFCEYKGSKPIGRRG